MSDGKAVEWEEVRPTGGYSAIGAEC